MRAAARNVTAVIEKISVRCPVLSRQIQEMLQLANLRSQSQAKPSLTVLDLRGMIQREVERVEPAGGPAGDLPRADLEPVLVRGTMTTW